MIISKFEGQYKYLSNFYPCVVKYNGISYRSSEAAYQAQKTEDSELRLKFADLSASEAKKLGQEIKIRCDWESIKNFIMLEILMAKFTQNENLKEKLLATEDIYLIEGNTWNDTYWGVCNGQGENYLGKALMYARHKIRRGDVERSTGYNVIERRRSNDGSIESTELSKPEVPSETGGGAAV